MRCLDDGSFDPLQCLDRRCLCISSVHANQIGNRVYQIEDGLDKLPCCMFHILLLFIIMLTSYWNTFWLYAFVASRPRFASHSDLFAWLRDSRVGPYDWTDAIREVGVSCVTRQNQHMRPEWTVQARADCRRRVSFVYICIFRKFHLDKLCYGSFFPTQAVLLGQKRQNAGEVRSTTIFSTGGYDEL